jgi:hypothetical protein
VIDTHSLKGMKWHHCDNLDRPVKDIFHVGNAPVMLLDNGKLISWHTTIPEYIRG